ncbi:MAG TPA: type 2 isopentenyl-diphosphate Delta-isomerase [Bacilli bacterium]|nr:type 2 isopentenyl-diphosphate Delta-isomerase [Bacilli bacterium]
MQYKRKDEHLKLALRQQERTNDFDMIRLKHHSVPELNVNEINLTTTIFGQEFSYPFYINAMTGGTKKAAKVNHKLAEIALHYNIPFFLGSQSIALKNETLQEQYYALRKKYPTLFLVANVNPNMTVVEAKMAIKMIDANALAIHVNSVQELAMAEGDRDFTAWLKNIEAIIKSVKVPVIVKEVGYGMTRETVLKLKAIGVKYFDISGAGGTDFTAIESARQKKKDSVLSEFKLSTVESLLDLENIDDITLHASGGIRNSVDIVKALALNAKAVGLARYFLKLTKYNERKIKDTIDVLIEDLKKVMCLVNIKNIGDLDKSIIYISKLK